jgi:flagellar protein FlgJ
MTLGPAQGNGGLAIDSKGLSALKNAAHQRSPEAIKNVSRQFEAIFLNMMLKSMRNATPQSGPLDSEQSKSFTAMLDQQLSQNIANKGIGLAEILAKQLSQNKSVDPANHPLNVEPKEGTDTRASSVQSTIGDAAQSRSQIYIQSTARQTPQVMAKLSRFGHKQYDERARASEKSAEISPSMRATMNEFTSRMSYAAEKVSRTSGVPVIFILAQAALESGWGKHVIIDANGQSSHNLFGIKATANWTGRVVDAQTNEFTDGEMVMRVEKFRAYDSYLDSFQDFTHFLKTNSRYQEVLKSLNDPISYSQAMQRSGYATDPNYGKKLQSVILNFMANME